MKSLVLIVLFVSCACATPAKPFLKVFPEKNGGRVTGGQDAVRDQFPYQISFEWGYSGYYEAWCGGSIISPLYVLTAGHCITGLPSYGSTRVVAGILDINENGVARDVVSWLVHPLYEGGVAPNDLALLRLESALPFSESVQPIALPAAGSEPQGQAVLSGWGSTSTGLFPSYPAILQYVDIPVLSYDECAEALTALFGTPDPLDETNVCTGPIYDGISACSGDSGGPLAQIGPDNSTEIIGIVSWGVTPCGYTGAPSVYVKVSSFIDFIVENVPDLP